MMHEDSEEADRMDAGDEVLPGRTVVTVTGFDALGCDPDGQTARMVVTSEEDGQVELVMSYAVLAAMVENVTVLRHGAEQAAAKTSRPHGFTVRQVGSFAVGSVIGVHGVVLTLNHRRPNEERFVIAQSKYAADLGKALVTEAARVAVIERSGGVGGKLLLPDGSPAQSPGRQQ